MATGSQPILPPIEGAEIKEGSRTFEATLENLQFVKLFQNAQEVIDKLNDKSQDIKRVAVVGAGYIGVELAEAFQRHGKEVILIDVVDTCLAGYYDHDLTELMAKNMESHGIKLAFGETVKAVEGETKVERIVTDKNAYDVDMVAVSYTHLDVYKRQVKLFDVYAGEKLGSGMKSMAYSLTFQNPNDNLTDEEVAKRCV